MLRDSLMITGMKTIIVPTIAIKEFTRFASKNRYVMTKAAVAKAMPTG